MTIEIKITYKAFSNEKNNRPVTSLSFVLPSEYETYATRITNVGLCDVIYDVTNQQITTNALWQVIEPLLPANRTHTSLSVGDEVTINNNTYLCADFGWEFIGVEQLTTGGNN
jgi:hypothetical protein